MTIQHRFSQNQKMQQKMALNAQMRQSIQLLRMAGQELNEYINASMEKNPFL